MLQDAAILQAHYPLFAPLVAFLFGSAIGSFINVVVYRLPIMLTRDWQQQSLEILADATDEDPLVAELAKRLPVSEKPFNLVVPNSTCPHCDVRIKPWHNIPIVGYFLIKGRCANCGQAISGRYPLVEATTALLTALVITVLGPNLQGLGGCFLLWSLIALALIDFDTQLLPDDITLPFLWLGLVVNYFGVMTSFSSAFLGACGGYLILWSVFHLFKLVTGKEGMGYGDFKMLAMLGAWLGLQTVPLIIVLSSFAGAIIGGAMILFGRDKAKPIKFGPFLAVAGLIALLWGDELIDMYLIVSFGA
jgi:leader peptidase (prepilin peptidase) / N-methyltransferase